MIRFLLAATLGSNYGIYGPAFELLRAAPQTRKRGVSGFGEISDQEWNLDRPDSLREFIALVNRIRNESPALQSDWYLNFIPSTTISSSATANEAQMAQNLIVIVVNLDPHYTQAGFITLPLDLFEIDAAHPYQAHDLITGARYMWTGPRNFVELNPNSVPGHILRIRRHLRSETDFDYFQ